MTGGRRRGGLERIADGYFNTKTSVMVQRVLATAAPGQIHDDDAMDALFDEFLDVLEERYDRDDPGWHDAAAGFLRSEFDRQVEQTRRRDEALQQRLREE